MRALVVFESMFGNTRDVAQGVADGLGTGAEVDLMEVGTAPEQLDPGVGLLVVGGPTQAFGMSRPGTRADAEKGTVEPVVSAGIGVREWLERLRTAPTGIAAAAFDTRIGSPRVPGSAARGAHRRLRSLGFLMVAPAESFFVKGKTGPLEPGEIERARSWGEELGRLMAAQVPTPSA